MRLRRSCDVKFDPNSIIGPVIPAPVWKGHADNVVRNGWSYEVYLRQDGIISSFIARVHRTAGAATRARQETIKLSRADAAARGIASVVHDCRTDDELLATIINVWGSTKPDIEHKLNMGPIDHGKSLI